MLRRRTLSRRLTRSSIRFSDDRKESCTLLEEEESVTSQTVGGKRNITRYSTKMKRSVRRGQRTLKGVFGNMPFIGHVLLQVTRNERMTIYSLNGDLPARVSQVYFPCRSSMFVSQLQKGSSVNIRSSPRTIQCFLHNQPTIVFLFHSSIVKIS